MLLKICDDNFFFYITRAKYFDVLCYLVIFLLIALIFLVQKDKIFNKFNNNKLIKVLTILFFGLFVGFLFFLFILILNKNSFNGCATKYYKNNYLNLDNNLKKELKTLNDNKVIIVGDSRMEFIEKDNNIVLPFNVDIIAKSGASIEWFEEFGMKETKNVLAENKYEHYSIVVNMGVNDIQYTSKFIRNANEYFDDYLELAKYNSKVDLYILSVNPIIEKKLNKAQPQNVRSNSKINSFNNTLIKRMKKADKDNIYYCDSNDYLNFKTDDGLHYTTETNKKIINYIVNKCVKF